MTRCRSNITRSYFATFDRVFQRFTSTHFHRRSSLSSSDFSRWMCANHSPIQSGGPCDHPRRRREIFAPRVRKRIGIGKCTGDDWLRVMRVAHEEGMNTSCTMLIGHIEFVRGGSSTWNIAGYAGLCAGRVSGFGSRVSVKRRRRYRAGAMRWPGVFAKSSPETRHPKPDARSAGSYTAFIHWPFQRENTPLGRAGEWDPMIHGAL